MYTAAEDSGGGGGDVWVMVCAAVLGGGLAEVAGYVRAYLWQSSQNWWWMTYSTTNSCCKIAPFMTCRHTAITGHQTNRPTAKSV